MKLNNKMKLAQTTKKTMSYTVALIVCCLATGISITHAEDLSVRRAEATKEVGPLFFNKFISIEAKLTDSSGPEYWQKLFGKPFVGCPDQPLESTGTYNIELTTSGAGPWAGSLDGINLKIESLSSFPGGALAMPSDSTAKAPSSFKGPELSFAFYQTDNVKRAAIDRAAQEIDKCLSKLPPGNYTGDSIARLCLYPEIPTSQLKQSCAVNTYGDIKEKLSDGSGYKVIVHEQLMCDSVGYGKPAPRNTGWVSCYQNTYAGVANITSGRGGARVLALRAASKVAIRKCSGKTKGNNRKIGRCATKSLAHSLAGGKLLSKTKST